MTESLEHPSVPQLLQEKLKDYPDVIADLQDSLNGVGRSAGMSDDDLTDEFEEAIWRLEDGLSYHLSEAREELKAAEAAQSPERIAKAKARELLMLDCRGSVKKCLDGLSIFFGK